MSETSAPPGPTLGPCTSWIDGDDVAACMANPPSNAAILDDIAVAASMVLFEVSGEQFPGLCERTVRPCRNNCGCWGGPVSYGLGPWYWTSSAWGAGLGGWAWWNERGDRFGCQPMSTVLLAGYPVREITDVRINGDELPALDDDGNPNWRLDKWRYLIRMDSPGPPVVPRFWPGCQNMSLDATQQGTFEVSYKWGTDPPQLGRDAAVEIALQLWLSCNGNGTGECKLPAGVTRLVRENVEIERGLLANWADPSKPVGLVATDAFLQAYADGQRRGRRPAVWTPDRQAFARTAGTG